MEVTWEPFWYDLDQTIIVGEENYFYLTTDKKKFASGLSSEDEYEVIAKIKSINHSELGNVKAIDCNGFNYYIYYGNGKRFTVCSEENPGMIFKGETDELKNWSFKIEIDIIEDTGLKAIDRRSIMNHLKFKEYWKKRRLNQEELISNL